MDYISKGLTIIQNPAPELVYHDKEAVVFCTVSAFWADIVSRPLG